MVALGLIAAATIFFAFAGVRSGPPATPRSDSNVPSATTAAESGTTSPPTVTESSSAASSPDDSSRTAEVPQDLPTPIDAARSALTSGEDVTIAVLGDSTSNERQEWVHLWAGILAQSRPVQVSHWDEADGTRFHSPDVLSTDGGGGSVDVWSGSVAGAAAEYPIDGIQAMLPERPDFVMFNFGHNNSEENIGPQLGELQTVIEELHRDVPIIVILQNPQVGHANAGVRQAAEEWADENGASVIDVAATFPAAEWPYLVDEIHPSAEGQQIWAEAVADALQ